VPERPKNFTYTDLDRMNYLEKFAWNGSSFNLMAPGRLGGEDDRPNLRDVIDIKLTARWLTNQRLKEGRHNVR